MIRIRPSREVGAATKRNGQWGPPIPVWSRLVRFKEGVMARTTVQRILLLLMAGVLVFGLCACPASKWVPSSAIKAPLGEDRLVYCISGPPPEFICDANGENCRPPLRDEMDSESNASTVIPELAGIVVLTLRPALNERRAASSVLNADPARSRRVLLVGRDRLKLLDMGTEAVTATVDLSGRFGSQVAVSSDAALAAVGVRRFSSTAPDGVDIIDVPAMTRIGTVDLPAGSGPSGISFIPGRRDFCVALRKEDAVRCFSLNDAGAAAPLREFTGCEEAGKVTFTADGERGLFSCKDTLWVYDILSDSVAQKITGFGNVRSLAVTLDGRRAYVADIKDDKRLLVIVDLETYDIVRTIELDAFPAEVFLGSDEQRVYVLSGRSLTIFDPEGNIQSVAPTPGFAIGGLAVNVGPS